MKRILIPFTFILAAVLAACSPVPEAATEIQASPTAEETETTPTEEAAATPPFPVADADNPCLPFSLMDVLLQTPHPNLPPVSADDWQNGPADAAVTFMVYSELQCPFCAQFEPLMVAIQEKYPDDVRTVFRHRPFPESFHNKSILAAQALEAAGKQGKFEEFKNFMFERQSKDPNNPAVADLPDGEFWSGLTPDQFDEWMAERVPDLGINADQFLEDMFSDEIVQKIQQKKDEADRLGINGTPTLFINGYPWPEQQRGVELFSIYTDLILSQEMEFDACPPTVIEEGKDYYATISTTQGDIVVDLFEEQAPIAVNSFIFLARQGWYDDLRLFVTDELALSGDPSDTGFGGSGYILLDEVNADLNFDEPGMLASYARLGPGMNTSSFFISKIPLTGQEGRTIFGRITEGLDVLEKLTLLETTTQETLDRVVSISITEN